MGPTRHQRLAPKENLAKLQLSRKKKTFLKPPPNQPKQNCLSATKEAENQAPRRRQRISQSSQNLRRRKLQTEKEVNYETGTCLAGHPTDARSTSPNSGKL